MPITKAQLESLTSFIGPEGIYFEVISEPELVDLGTKILYLERAINQDCYTFLLSLDKLYASIANQNNSVEIIRALKVINDLCHNNQVKYGDFGIKTALDHYFSALGSVNSEEFRVAITDIINTGITTLSTGHKKAEITAQKTARQTVERALVGLTQWRIDLDLPISQRDKNIVNGRELTREQIYNLRSPAVCSCITEGWMSFAQAETLSDKQTLLLCNAATYSFIRTQNITADAVLAFTDQQCDYLKYNISISRNIAKGVADGWIELTQVRALNEDQWEFLDDAKIYTFLRAQNITAENVLALTGEQIRNLSIRGIRAYAISHSLPPEQALALKPNWLRNTAYYVAAATIIVALALLTTSVVGTIGFIPFLVAASVSATAAIIGTHCKRFVIDPTNHEKLSQVIDKSATEQEIQPLTDSSDSLTSLPQRIADSTVVAPDIAPTLQVNSTDPSVNTSNGMSKH